MNRSQIVLLIFCLLICGGHSNAQTPPPPTITVIGSAEVKVAPDEASFRLEIETLDEDLQKAKTLNDAILQKLLAALKPLIPDQRLIQTGFVSLERESDVDTSKDEARIFSAYKLSRDVSIVLRDLSQFDTLLAEIVKAGVPQIANIELRSSKLREHQTKARTMAVKAAQEKASVMAAELGQTIGKAILITEQDADSDSLFNPGLISVKANVSVSFELK